MKAKKQGQTESRERPTSPSEKGKPPSMKGKPGERSKSGEASQPARLTTRPDSGEPGGGEGRVDITGVVPEDFRVDPNITEGHPGYDESGDSEIIPAERFTKRESSGGDPTPQGSH